MQENSVFSKICLRPAEAAEMMSVSERKLLQMCKTDGFPFVKCGRIKLFIREDIVNWLRARSNGGVANGIAH